MYFFWFCDSPDIECLHIWSVNAWEIPKKKIASKGTEMFLRMCWTDFHQKFFFGISSALTDQMRKHSMSGQSQNQKKYIWEEFQEKLTTKKKITNSLEMMK